MLQSFAAEFSSRQSARRLARLRREFSHAGIDAFMVPVADAFRCSPVASRDRRLAWLTGFDGSAGLCVVTTDKAALFVDGRYTEQAAAQTQPAEVEIRGADSCTLRQWIADSVPESGSIGFDPWLHGIEAIEKLESRMQGRALVATDNLVDRIWTNQPPPPDSPLVEYPDRYAGESRESKIERIAAALSAKGADFAVFTNANSVAWLLNIRGTDIPRTPLKHAFAILGLDNRVKLFVRRAAEDPDRDQWLGTAVSLHSFDRFAASLDALSGRVLIDPGTACWAAKRLVPPKVETVLAPDPCAALKARKNESQIAAIREAHLLDGAAVAAFLAWLDSETAAGSVSEIGAAEKLEELRRATGCLHDISFDTISACGPNAAFIHYRVTTATNRTLEPGSLYLVDSGRSVFVRHNRRHPDRGHRRSPSVPPQTLHRRPARSDRAVNSEMAGKRFREGTGHAGEAVSLASRP